MEISKLKAVIRRLLAFVLSLLLVISILPVNLMTVWSETQYTVAFYKNGNGKCWYQFDGQEASVIADDGQFGDFSFNPDDVGYPKLIISADSGNQMNSLELSSRGSVEITNKYKMEIQLEASDFTKNPLEIKADFEEEQQTVYTVKASETNEHLTVSVLDGTGTEPTVIDAQGRQYSELPLTIQVSPESAAYEIDSVKVNENDVTLENHRFTLTESMFNAQNEAEIAATVKSAVADESYRLDPVNLTNCSATITRGENEAETLVSGAEFTAADFVAGVTLTFTAKTEEGKRYVVSSVKINEAEKTQESDHDQATFSYILTKADFGEQKTIQVEAVFVELAEAPKLVIGDPEGYEVWVKNYGESYPAEPQTGTVELVYPATIKVRSMSERNWVSALDVSFDNGDAYTDAEFEPGDEAELVLPGGAVFNNIKTMTLHVALTPVYDVSLSNSSSQYAQVFASLKGAAGYPETSTEITAASPFTVLSGSSVKATVSAEAGYIVTSVKVNNTEPSGLSFDGNGASFELTSISAEQRIKVETEKLYTIELTDSDLSNGTVKVLGQNNEELGSITSDAPLSLRAEALAGAKLQFAATDGAAIYSLALEETEEENARKSESYEITLPTQEASLQALFGEDNTLSVAVVFKQMFTITIASAEYGTVTASCGDDTFAENQNYSVFAGEDLSFNADPDHANDYIVQSVELSYSDGTAAESISFDTDIEDKASFTVTASKDVTITVIFVKRASFSSIKFYWNNNEASYLEPLYSTNACQVFVFKPNSDSRAKLNMRTEVNGQTYDVFFNNWEIKTSPWKHYQYDFSDEKRLMDSSVYIDKLSYKSYYGGHPIKAPGSDFYTQHMFIIIDKDAPVIDDAIEAYNGKYYSSAPELELSINEPVDAVAYSNGAPAEAAGHAFSGLSKLYYYIGEYEEGKELGDTGTYEIYSYVAGSSIQSDSQSFEIAVDALTEGLNAVTIVVVDRAGNKAYKTIRIGYNSKLGLSFDELEHYADEDDGTVYYQAYRTATILVRDTAEGFNPDGISFTGTSTSFEYIDSDWIPSEVEENTYTRRIRFKDGSYQLEDLCYASNTLDEANNQAITSIPVNEAFVVDTTKPVVMLRIDGDDEHAWSSLLTSVSFGIWKKEAVSIKATIQDYTGVNDKNKEYYIQEYTEENDSSFLTEAQLQELYESNHGVWHKYTDSGISVGMNKRFVIYFRVKDKAGHVVFVSTNGIITDNCDPNASVGLPATSHTHNGNKLYGREGGPTVDVSISASDPEIHSGLRSVAYWVTTTYMTDEEALAGTGWTEVDLAPGTNPKYSELALAYSENIAVQKSINACTVYVYEKAVDNAGRTVIRHEVFDVDYVAPSIVITPDSEDDHVVWITYTERSSHFDPTNAEEGLTVTGTDGNGNVVTLTKGVDYYMSWESNGDANLDTDTHVIKLTIVTDAIYNITAETTDLAGNHTETNSTGFTVDTLPPEGTITVAEKGTWNKLLETLTFGLWSSNESLAVTGTAKDNMSGLQSVSYYKHTGTAALNEEALEGLGEDWTEIPGEWGTELVSFNVTTLEPNERAVIYIRLIDNKGLTKYLGTDGVVIDSAMDQAWITLTPSADADKNGLYNREDTVSVAVEAKDYADQTAANAGIQKVEYWIEAPGAESKHEELYSFEYFRANGENPNGGRLTIKEYGQTVLDETGTVPAYEDLTHEWSGTISVDMEQFNNCAVEVRVKVTDNAGNSAERSVILDIDNTDPTIAITRDEEKCLKLDSADEGFYHAYTALITYTERTHHFSEEDAEAMLIVTGSDASGEITLKRGEDYRIVGWNHTEQHDNHDADTHIMEIQFLTDANYKVTAGYTDLAGNSTEDSKLEFTLDTKAPDGTITVEGKGTWSKLLETLSFGLWSKESLDVTGTAKDAVCNVKSVEYYLTTDTDAKSLEALADESAQWVMLPGEWTTEAAFDVMTIAPDQKCVLYLRLMDRAGNVKIICTDGVVVEQLFEQDDITLGTSNASGEDANGKPVYGIQDEVFVRVKVQDKEPWSGIQLVTYEISAPGCESQIGTLYSYSYTRDEGDNANGGHLVIEKNGLTILDETGVLPSYENLTHEFEGTITVDKARFNSCQTTVKITAKDNAGNEMENGVLLDIDNTAPTIEVSYATEQNPRAIDNYYTKVTATVTITERDHHFDSEAATDGIKVRGYDVNQQELTLKAGTDYIISGWESKEGSTPDDCKHVATIQFITDANYSLNISYTDRATNHSDPDYSGSFTKDETRPTGSLEIKALTDKTWIDEIIENLTFALFSRESVEVAHKASDEISPLISVDYFRTNRDTVYSEAELSALDEGSWESIDESRFAAGSLSMRPDSRLVVYLRVIDAAGNIRYVSTDGFILDATNPTVDQVAPRVTVSQPTNGIYNTDVPIRVKVSDPIVNNSYSGLKEIRYEVKNMGSVTQSGTLYTYTGTAAKQNDLLQHWENESAITVDTEKNNSNNVEITVYAVDNAGNESHDSVEIKIDVTAPTISVSYDNNNGDTAFADNRTDAYFNAPRTATIVITERNFDSRGVVVTVTKNGVEQNYNLSWTQNTAGGNGDGTTNTGRIVFDSDGDYTIAVSCTDLAGNRNRGVTYNGLAPERFTIDMTKPNIEVRYDNNNQQNDSFFNAPRTATVTIEEHNFEKTRIEVKLTAKYEDRAISLPKVSGWTSSGDTHIAKIEYTADGDYTFDIAYRDKAGNENKPVAFANDTKAGSAFTVDTTPPAVTITGVNEKSANTDETIHLKLEASDINFDSFEPVLMRYYLENGKPVREALDIADYIHAIDNGMVLDISNLEVDGVYILTCTVIDKAGNAFTEFTGNDGKTVQVKDRNSDEGLLFFSVNRIGSTFYADDNTIDLFDRYYVEIVNNDVVIYEINPDVLTEHTISLNNEELAENRDYTVTVEQDAYWNRYTYKISKDLFTAEGFYDLVIVSRDYAGNIANTNRKNVRSFSEAEPYRVEFVVDKTPPVVTVSGLEDNGRYQTDLQTVTLIPADDGGQLGTLRIVVMDENGNVIATPWDLTSEELQNLLKDNDGKITFTLAESSDQYYVAITCSDIAGNETKLQFKEVTVSTSAFRIFWANKPLRWGSIGGVGGTAALFFILLLAKKRKKKGKEVVPENKEK